MPESGASSSRRRPLRGTRLWLRLAFCGWLSLSPLFALLAYADSYDERRVRTGARLFRSLLAADTALKDKLAADGALLVWVYSADGRLGEEMRNLLSPPGDPAKSRVRGYPLDIRVLDRLPGAADRSAPMGLFLASPPPAGALPELVRWAVASRCILFSPFEGHVEQGVTAGLAIEAKVQPFLNRQSLEASGLVLKPFFLKVAKVHP